MNELPFFVCWFSLDCPQPGNGKFGYQKGNCLKLLVLLLFARRGGGAGWGVGSGNVSQVLKFTKKEEWAEIKDWMDPRPPTGGNSTGVRLGKS